MTTRRWIIAAVGLLVVAIAVFNFRPRDWHGQLVTPASVPTEYVTFHCPAAWGSGSVTGPANLGAPVAGDPCGDRRTLQVVGAVDVGLGIGAIAFLLFWRRRDPGEPGFGGRATA